MYVATYDVTITVDASGDGTGYTPVITGRILNVIYTKDDYAAGVDFTITAEGTSQGVIAVTDQNASATWAPVQDAHSTAGADLGAAAWDWFAPICVANDRIKIVVAQGGNAKSGTFTVVVV